MFQKRKPRARPSGHFCDLHLPVTTTTRVVVAQNDIEGLPGNKKIRVFWELGAYCKGKKELEGTKKGRKWEYFIFEYGISESYVTSSCLLIKLNF